MYELIIAGAGPAGLTAAVYTARKGLNALLISKDIGGQTNLTLSIENYMGYQFVQGPELMRKFEDQVKQFPIGIETGEGIERVRRVEKGFEFTTESGRAYQSSAAIITTGKRQRKLGVPGEDRLLGMGVSYCAICDGPFFRGVDVAVIGGGNSALEAVADLVRIARRVYLISLTSLTCDRILAERAKDAHNLTMLTKHEVLSINGDDSVSAIIIRSLDTGETINLDVNGVFVEIGLIPNSEPVKDLLRLNAAGEIEVNCLCETEIPGIYAAGDVTNTPEKQIVIAAGEGAKAALQAHRYLQRMGP